MKKNTYFLIIGAIALCVLFSIVRASELHSPNLAIIIFLIGVIIAYLCRRFVDDTLEDELTHQITEKAALRTLQIALVFTTATAIGMIVFSLNPLPPPFEHHFPRPDRIIGNMGLTQLFLPVFLLFIYTGFRQYYAYKFGYSDSFEEQD